jgi:AraC-like DNA-binding protein
MTRGVSERGVAVGVVAAVARVLGELGAFTRSFDESGARYVSGPQADALLDDAAVALGDPAPGIAVARRMAPGTLGLLDYALFTGETWGVALRRVAQFYAVATERVTMSIDESGDEARVLLARDPGYRQNRHWIELSFAVIAERARQAIGPEFRVRSVDFAHAAPPTASAHESHFGAPVRFDQPVDRLLFDRAWLASPLRTSAGALAEVLELRLAELVPVALDPVMLRVREAIIFGIDAGDVSLETVAGRLGTSARSLQRMLREHGTGFKELLDLMRRDRALALLQKNELTIADVGRRVGFADSTTFFRAFRRWTGTTPGSQRGAGD